MRSLVVVMASICTMSVASAAITKSDIESGMTATADIVATLIVCSQKIPDGGYGQAAQEVESSFHRMFEASRMSSPNFEELYLAKLGTMMELNAQTWGSSTSSEPRAAKVTRCNDKLTNAKYWMGVFNAKVKAAGRK